VALDTKQMSEDLINARGIRNRMPVEDDPYARFGAGTDPYQLYSEQVSERNLPNNVDPNAGQYEVPSWRQAQETESEKPFDMTGYSGQRQFLGPPPFGPPMAPAEGPGQEMPIRPEMAPFLGPPPPWLGPPPGPEGGFLLPFGPPPGPDVGFLQPLGPPGPDVGFLQPFGPPPGPDVGFLQPFGPPPEGPMLFPAMVPSWERLPYRY
jgi:hypothetical protein